MRARIAAKSSAARGARSRRSSSMRARIDAKSSAARGRVTFPRFPDFVAAAPAEASPLSGTGFTEDRRHASCKSRIVCPNRAPKGLPAPASTLAHQREGVRAQSPVLAARAAEARTFRLQRPQGTGESRLAAGRNRIRTIGPAEGARRHRAVGSRSLELFRWQEIQQSRDEPLWKL